MRARSVDHDPVRVVIVGGGGAALEALVALRAMVPRGVDAVVVADADRFVYRPPQVGEPFGLGDARRYPLAELCSGLSASFVHDRVVSVDADARTITTLAGSLIAYDLLVLAVGARPIPAFEHGAVFDRETVTEDFEGVLPAAAGGLAERVAVIVPEGATWSLAAYELALLTAARSPHSEVMLVTHESTPLALFGAAASQAVADILDEASITVRTSARAAVAAPTALRVGGERIEANRVVSLPLLTGLAVPGVPSDEHGFTTVDEHGRVDELPDVYAAGDGTTVPVKQGALGAQQADAVATHIASRLGADVQPAPLRPVLRGLLLTRRGPRYLRAELDDRDATSAISQEPLWWPPSKVASRWLAPHLERVSAERVAGVFGARSR